jgi:predicted RNA-binding protein YlxR (DUF448 family)
MRVPGARRKHVPLRSCVVCHEKRPKRELIRVVRVPNEGIEIDPRGKQPGRGAYVCREPACWQDALEARLLSRALRFRVTPDDLTDIQAAIAARLSTEDVARSPAVVSEEVET